MKRKKLIISCTIMYILGILTYVIINMMGENKNERQYEGQYSVSTTSNISSSKSDNTITTNTIKSSSGTSRRTSNDSKTRTRKTTKIEQKVGTYILTHYGPDCKGCGGSTASGYNVRNTIYYKDHTYGSLRIVAMKNIPLYSVIKIKNYKSSGDIYAIVLDRPKNNIIDLLVESESKASDLGIQKNVEIEVIRNGK